MKNPKRKKYGFFSSLYWKIAVLFLFALIIISIVYLYIAAFTAEMYFQEASQRLNEEVALHIAEENQFFVNGEANQEALKKIFHDIMVINPSIEVYLLNTEGKIQVKELIDYYMKNAALIRKEMETLGYECVGGDNSPYIWVDSKMDSWKFFDMLLEKAGVVCTPGSGFGQCGEGYIRISAFNHYENVEKAMERIKKVL